MVKLIVDDEQERAEYTGDWFAGILISAEQESDNVTILNMHAMTLLKNVKELKNEVVQKLRETADALEAYGSGCEPVAECDELNDRDRNR
ncbi:MAG: hypothetical protein ACOX7W_08065 [Christensenellales bacterium]